MASPYSIIINPKFSEKDWIVQMEQNLDLDLDAVAQTPLCIYHVPESLRISKRDAYSPQYLALGPYHHWKPELYQAETHKLAAAKRAQRDFHLPADFRDFVAGISRMVPDVRACYDRHLQMTDQALAWIIAVDSLFLLHLIYSGSDDKNKNHHHHNNNPLFFDSPASGSRKSLLRDAVMMENQIPTFVLAKILANFSDSGSSRGRLLASVSVDFCNRVSPLGLPDPDPEDLKPRHLLDLLYQLILNHNKSPAPPKPGAAEVSEEFQANGNGNGNGFGNFPKRDPGSGTGFVTRVKGIYSAWLRRVAEEETTGLVPTATQLRNAGVKFGITKLGIRSIRFNKETKTLTLPVFTWKPDCEVVMRNLVAYEAVARLDSSPVLGRYADLMNSVCRTAEDVKLLHQEGILIGGGGAGSDAVLEVFGGRGMGTAMGGGKRTVLDGEIEAANEFYAGNRKVEVWKLATRYGKRVWEVATFLAALFLLLFFFFHIVIDIFRYPPGSPGNVAAAAADVAKILIPSSSLPSSSPSSLAASL